MPTYLSIQDVRREIRRAIAPFLPLLPPGSGPGSGDVVGPSSSTDNAIARWDGATGTLLQDSSVLISDGGEVTFAANIFLAQGRTLWLDTDADTGIYADPDDKIHFETGGVDRMWLSNTALELAVDLDLDGQILYLDADADSYLQAFLDDNIRMTVGGVSTMVWTPTLVSSQVNFTVLGTLDIDGNELILDADGNSSLRETADNEITLKLSNVDQITFKDSGIHFLSNEWLWCKNQGGVAYDTDGDTYQYCSADDRFWTLVGGANYMLMRSSYIKIYQTLNLNSQNLDNPGNIDAKGDLMVGTANNTWARLPVGSDGQRLEADSGEATGLKWVTP